MKPVVLALNAQFGVGAGGNISTLRCCGFRALSNGMENPTLLPWRPVLVLARNPQCGEAIGTAQDENLQCGDRESGRCVQSSLPCVVRCG